MGIFDERGHGWWVVALNEGFELFFGNVGDLFDRGAIQQNYSVALDPGVVSHRMKPMPVSVKSALRIASSRSLPGGMVLARFLTF